MANSKFVIDTGLVVGPLTIFASNGDIRTSGNIINTSGGPDNVVGGLGSGFVNSTLAYFPGVAGGVSDYAVTTTTVDGVSTTVDESSSGLTNFVPVLDAFGVAIAESALGNNDTYDCMEPAGLVELVDLGVLT